MSAVRAHQSAPCFSRLLRNLLFNGRDRRFKRHGIFHRVFPFDLRNGRLDDAYCFFVGRAASSHTGRLFFHLRQRINRHRGGSLSSHLLKCAMYSKRRLYRRFFSCFSFTRSAPFRICSSSCRSPFCLHTRCIRALWRSGRTLRQSLSGRLCGPGAFSS